MIPLKDNIPSRTTPVVNYALIAACIGVFVLQLLQTDLTEQLAMIPARVFGEAAPQQGSFGRMRPALDAMVPDWFTLLTCTFLHGDWLHLLGNLWILWIFGDNVEDCLGHARYLGFYLVCGVAASATHLLLSPDSPVMTVGASGAIAGVMGAYMVLYPRALVITLIPLWIIMEVVALPAVVFLGIWFALQLVHGTFSIGANQGGGVAWWAHIGGFVAGLLGVWLLRRGNARPTVDRRRVSAVGRYSMHDTWRNWR